MKSTREVGAERGLQAAGQLGEHRGELAAVVGAERFLAEMDVVAP